MNQSEPVKYSYLSDVEELIKEIIVRVGEAFTKLGIEHKREISEDVESIWMGLSELYYRYEDEGWKRAFREVFYYVSEKIQEDQWQTVYKNLYRREHLKKVV